MLIRARPIVPQTLTNCSTLHPMSGCLKTHTLLPFRLPRLHRLLLQTIDKKKHPKQMNPLGGLHFGRGCHTKTITTKNKNRNISSHEHLKKLRLSNRHLGIRVGGGPVGPRRGPRKGQSGVRRHLLHVVTGVLVVHCCRTPLGVKIERDLIWVCTFRNYIATCAAETTRLGTNNRQHSCVAHTHLSLKSATTTMRVRSLFGRSNHY